MLYALNNKGEKTRAQPDARRAKCPGCHEEVIAKCGQVVIWHWAHAADSCGVDWEPETQWHLDWKAQFPSEWVEVFKDGRRADVLLPSGMALEFQRRSLDPETIEARETTWGRLTWIMYAEDLTRRTLGDYSDVPRLSVRARAGRETYRTFRWRHPRLRWEAARQPIIMDLGRDELLEVQKIHWDLPVGGWGYLRSRGEMLAQWGSSTQGEQDELERSAEMLMCKSCRGPHPTMTHKQGDVFAAWEPYRP